MSVDLSINRLQAYGRRHDSEPFSRRGEEAAGRGGDADDDAAGRRELVGLRLIIEPSPWPQRGVQPRLAVLRRLAVRVDTAASERQEISSCDRTSCFVGLEFLKSCLFCRRKIDGDMDVFVYKGDQAFCSGECRCQQMAKEERREMEIMARKRRDAFHRRHQRAAPASIRPLERHHPRVQQTAS